MAKVGLDKLAHIDRIYFEGQDLSSAHSQIIRLDKDGLRYDFLWAPKENATKIFVLFSGNILRSRGNTPPVFQRWSWADRFPGSCLYVSDPVLHLHETLGSGWYSGTHETEVMPTIVEFAKGIARQFGVSDSNIVSYGSSAGGFGSLRFGLEIPGSTVVTINPQVILANRSSGSRKAYLKHCFPLMSESDALAAYERRFDLRQRMDELRQINIIYAQNTVDVEHVDLHYTPFCEALGVEPGGSANPSGFLRLLFEHEGGHAKAETSEVFEQAIRIIQNDVPYSDTKLSA